ncbi:hypothetical protein HBP99_15170 [Listeria booriae]|uniref:hypothetical protein n=1 Tax=Listeria booriae TaxID=1552123 RepID=UPI0016287C96|nr:hypothetical protein [Listeria booriae]MBC1209459.1 hypothetical protein [Listeria booriae]MBC1233172.1 hypothetical protein [Listeria booriae]MBC2369968.1 hypothetical protein [Listeria booriae]
MQYYVTVNADGYIDGWSDSENEGTIAIQATDNEYLKFECVRVVNGKAVLDESKLKALQNEPAPTSEIEQLKAQNIEFRDTILDLAIIIDNLGGNLE